MYSCSDDNKKYKVWTKCGQNLALMMPSRNCSLVELFWQNINNLSLQFTYLHLFVRYINYVIMNQTAWAKSGLYLAAEIHGESRMLCSPGTAEPRLHAVMSLTG